MYKNSILSYYSEVKLIKSGEMPIPRMALFSISSKCNASCPYCIYAAENKNGVVIDENKAYDVINQLADYGVQAIDLCGGGDPLVANYFDKLCYHVHKRKMKFGVITNGINFNGDNMKAILEWGSYVRISFDSIDKEVYKTCKGVDQAEKVFENLVTACKHKEKTKSKCEISVKIGISKKNCEVSGLYKTLGALKQLPLNRIAIRLLRKTEDEILDEQTKQSIYANAVMIDSSWSPDNIDINLEKTKIDKQCWMSPIHTVINSDGNVYICCYYVGREKQHCIGNILKQDFADIWGSKLHCLRIKEIDPDICQIYDCKFHEHHRIFEDFLDKGTPEFC